MRSSVLSQEAGRHNKALRLAGRRCRKEGRARVAAVVELAAECKPGLPVAARVLQCGKALARC